MKEINKLNSVLDYYKGNLAFNYHLYYRAFNMEEDIQKCIINKEYIMASMVSTISNIMLTIKEEIVENTGNLNFESKVFSNSLNETISLIADKEENGFYSINGHIIGTAPYTFAIIRNKLAHGKFYLDLKHSRIILNIDNNDIIININKLSNFVIKAFNSYITALKSENYQKRVFYINDFQTNRKKPFSSVKEIKSFINNIKCLDFSISRKDGKILDLNERFKTDEVLNQYFKNPDISIINKFYQSNKDNYNINYNLSKVNIPETDKLADSLFKMTHKNTDFNDQANYLIEKVGEIYHNDNKYESSMHFLRNLITLEAIYNTNSIKVEKLREYEHNNYPNINVVLSYEELSSSLISSFTSLFSYSLDDIFENKNEYTNKDLDGLDYSKLDMSKLNISKYTIEEGRYNDILLKRNARVKQLNKLNTSLNSIKSQLNSVDKTNTNVINILNIKVNNITSLISTITNEINTYDEGINYFNNNCLYLKNKAIINGIRNSISHGNFRFSKGDTFTNGKIIFEDIYEGKTTFKCEVKVLDFLEFLTSNQTLVSEFITSKLEENNKIKSL